MMLAGQSILQPGAGHLSEVGAADNVSIGDHERTVLAW